MKGKHVKRGMRPPKPVFSMQMSEGSPVGAHSIHTDFNMNEIEKTLPQLLGMLRNCRSERERKESGKSRVMVRPNPKAKRH
ncbi:hypothetical protein GQ457_09G016760 [Hibiscus cannabinus]